MIGDAPARVELPLNVHTSGRKPLLREAAGELRALVRHHELLRYMTMNSLRSTYDGTFFGYLWWLLDPMLNTAVYLFMVGIVMQRGGGDFALFLATSLVVWKFFSSSTRNAIGLMGSKAPLMRQVMFPRSVLPLAGALAETVRFGFAVVALLLFGTLFGVYPDPSLWAIVPITAIILVLGLGFGYLLSALNILFRDTYALTGYWFQLWFYLSPGLYTIDAIPERYQRVYMLNPFATLLPALHTVILDHESPDWDAVAKQGVVASGFLVVGFLVFVRLQRLFAKLQ